MVRRAVLVAALLWLAGCGDDGAAPGPDAADTRDAAAPGDDGSGGGDAPAPDAAADAPDSGPDVGSDTIDAATDVPPPPEGRPHGASCEKPQQCTGRLCLTPQVDPAFVGGYCSGTCVATDPASCGPGAACFDLEGLPLCVARCASAADCRTPGYVCAGSCVPAAFTADVTLPGVLDGTEADVADVVAAVDLDRMLRRVRVLSGDLPYDGGAGEVTITSRDVLHPDHALAEEYLAAELVAAGLDVTRDEFADFAGMTNLVAEVPGLDPDLPPVLIVAHYDSTSYSTEAADPYTDPAPGASDNASGVAIALEVAGALVAPDAPRLRRTVRLVLFDGEEWGLYGSRHYVAELEQAGEPTACAVNVDMVGAAADATAGHFWLLLEGDADASGALGLEAIRTFVPAAGPVPTAMEDTGGSDGTSFGERGRCALSLIAWPRLPTNHTTGDLVADFQPAFFESVARSAAAVVAALAGQD